MLRKFFTRHGKQVIVGTGVTWLSVGTYALYHDKPVADTSQDGTPPPLIPQFPQWILSAPRFVETISASLLAKFYLHYLNTFSSTGTDKFIGAVKYRKPSQALITVSNHTSTVDDPSIFAALLPWNVLCRPSLNRWTLCSQEYCFERGALIATFFNGGKTLPIKRGAGINHAFLERLFDKVQAGEWVHIFPEGRIAQEGTLAGRGEPLRSKVGRLKWGVGKLIARASVPPLVIPIYHIGMDKVMPQKSHKLKSMIPRIGENVSVIIGDPVPIDDLLADYHRRMLRPTEWTSTEAEEEVYSAITRRVEEALLRLEKQHDMQQQQHSKKLFVESAMRHKKRLAQSSQSP